MSKLRAYRSLRSFQTVSIETPRAMLLMEWIWTAWAQLFRAYQSSPAAAASTSCCIVWWLGCHYQTHHALKSLCFRHRSSQYHDPDARGLVLTVQDFVLPKWS